MSPAPPTRTSQDSQCARFGCDVEVDTDGWTLGQHCLDDVPVLRHPARINDVPGQGLTKS